MIPTIPTTLGQELKTNPFLRVDLESVHKAAEQHVGQVLNSQAEVLAALREWKNNF